MKPPVMTKAAFRLAIALTCCWLTGCASRPTGTAIDVPPAVSAAADTSAQPAMDFKKQQTKLFYEIDHKLVYQSCQELMRLSRAGKLTGSVYYCDDPAAKWSELPEPIRALGPTSVQVDEMMVWMMFLSADGAQHLQCFSNEFGEPEMPEGAPKGSGVRKDPFARDELSGRESLDDLNRDYVHFEMSLRPGLSYQVSRDERPQTLEQLKRSAGGSEGVFAWVRKSVDELTVKKQRLLYRTNHQALLAACRESIKRFNDGAFSTPTIYIMSKDLLEHTNPPVDREKYARDLKQIPPIILGLEPINIMFEKNRVTLVFMGGFDHAGVFAYLDDKEAVSGDDDMELIPGLRYYDDGLREAREECLSYLKSLEHEALSPIDWQRKQMNLPLPVRK
jgi:hypothetical protein